MIALLVLCPTARAQTTNAIPQTQVQLVWTRPVGEVDAICIYASQTAASNYVKLATLPGTATNWLVSVPIYPMFFFRASSSNWFQGEGFLSAPANTPVVAPPEPAITRPPVTNSPVK